MDLISYLPNCQISGENPVLARPFWRQPVFFFRNYFYAALVAIVHRKI
jgi:hypothetical protein